MNRFSGKSRHFYLALNEIVRIHDSLTSASQGFD
jgi:hypothetical protein